MNINIWHTTSLSRCDRLLPQARLAGGGHRRPDPRDPPVHRLACRHRCLENAGVADHVGVREVADDRIEPGALDRRGKPRPGATGVDRNAPVRLGMAQRDIDVFHDRIVGIAGQLGGDGDRSSLWHAAAGQWCEAGEGRSRLPRRKRDPIGFGLQQAEFLPPSSSLRR